MSMCVHNLGKLFQFKNDGTSPVYQNTVVVVFTYIFIIGYLICQVKALPDGLSSWWEGLDMLVDASGISTLTYVLIVAFQNLPKAVPGKSVFSENIWLIGADILYVILLCCIPRPATLNIFMLVYTVGLIFGSAYCTYDAQESGQAGNNKMKERREVA